MTEDDIETRKHGDEEIEGRDLESGWKRVSPVPRSGFLEESHQHPPIEETIEGQLHDPLWLLGRQRQFHEFSGSDAGTSVDADVSLEIDPIASVEFRGDSETNAVRPYDGGPVEAIIERERVLTSPASLESEDEDIGVERGAPGELAAETGRQFQRLLERVAETTVDLADVSDTFHLERPEEPMDAADRRYFSVVAGRTLDGAAVFDRLEAIVRAAEEEPRAAIEDAADDQLPIPDDVEIETAVDVLVEYYEWYGELYDESTTADTAWRPSRLEYDAAITTGTGGDAARFEIDDYPGGRLEWEDFIPSDESAPTETGDFEIPEQATRDMDRFPSKIRLPGMPTRRWWEFAREPLALDDLAADGSALPRALALEFTLTYGGNWVRIPIDVPVGSYARITDLTLTDSFGIVEEATPVDDEGDENWRTFRTEFEHHDRPGLLVPPTVPQSTDSDPYEQVIFARDELANLAFGIEEQAPGPTGRPMNRDEFTYPELAIRSVTPAEDPAAEQVVLENVGDDALSIEGYTVQRRSDDEPVYTFGDVALSPEESLTLRTVPAEDDEQDPSQRELWIYDSLESYESDHEDDSLWSDAEAVAVYDGPRTVAVELMTRPDDVSGAYHLVTSVPSHWFPFTMEPATDEDDEALSRRDMWKQSEYRLRRALLLDADTIDVGVDAIPRPQGTILDPDAARLPPDDETLLLYEEEVTRSGCEVQRRDQFVRWSDGSVYFWRGNEVTQGRGELASGLRFDTLEE